MIRRFARSCLGGFGVTLLALSVADGREPDRLERFRELATSRLAASAGEESAAEVYREIYTLLDEEVVESLQSGGPFASLEFLAERLDAFSEAWGTTAIELMRAGSLLVASVVLSDAPASASVRVYGRLRDEAALLTAIAREGRPTLHPLPPAEGGAAQFLVAWEGAASGRGSRALRVDLFRQRVDGVRLAWSTAEVFPGGVNASEWSVRGADVRIRYELHYPGWAPGCEGQTEQEDVYRLGPAGTVTRIARRQVNAWHRDFRLSVSRLFSAIAAGDRAVMAGLVPDAALRRRLPLRLREDPACDAPDGPRHDRVSVAASAADGPWQLVFQRSGREWRLVRATPVLE